MRRAPILLFLLPAVLCADDIHLKGAGTVSGQILEQSDTMVMVNIGDGIIGVPRDRIDHIVKARSPLDDYDERAQRLGPKDLGGWRALARWAAQQGINTQSHEAYSKVLAIEPDDREAREALGYERLDGRWVTEEEGYRARGYVLYDGEWMTPAEAQIHQQNSAAEQAARDAEQRASDAEVAKLEAETRAEEAEEQAREAEEDSWRNSYSYDLGGWGYGVTYWPSASVGTSRPANRPARSPVRGVR